ncbi:adenosine deaminase 2-like [Agrilus planipennis]|uniref:Adenosine deaminase n=1 Tax=Agrilus planipennis TaxID=224129 RepID=A0A1W4WZ20_AGRPL|nr:adenosine deaminase 2-like [Agrilus planipennis]
MHPMLFYVLLAFGCGVCLCDYWKDREELIKEEESQILGSSIKLTHEEEVVNKRLIKIKSEEFNNGFDNVVNFLPSQHFFKTKAQVENSKVFKFIQKLPKGANLHVHDTALVSGKFLFNLTYRNNLYACFRNGSFQLKFFSKPESSCKWILLKKLRQISPSVDDFISSKFSLIVDNPERMYKSVDEVWTAFQDIFAVVSPLITYRPVFEDYFYRALEELYEDNVMYLEFRGLLPEVYELNGTVYDEVEVAGLYINVLKKFKEDHPDFVGAKFIYAPMRLADNATAWKYVETVKTLKEYYPDFLAGFDLVGEEKKGYPLKNFIEQIKSLEGIVKFFFHAGETKWYGTDIDENLVDAILLNTSRIGHGFALLKHPKLLQMVKEKDIAIEVNPISNQVLTYVKDLRNHPAIFYINQNYPVVICNDDPSFWGTKGLSYDWYMAFMGLSSKYTDLRFLKQLAINSLKYSMFSNDDERNFAFSLWEKKWKKFIMDFLQNQELQDYENIKVVLV